MTQAAREILFWSTILPEIKREFSELTIQLNDIERYCSLPIKNRLARLFLTIAEIRQLNYRSQINLEVDQIKAAELWASIEPSLKQKVEQEAAPIRREGSALNYEIGCAKGANSEGFLKKRLSDYKVRVTDFRNRTLQSQAPVLSCLASLEQRVSTVWTVINITSKASFKLKEDEIPIIAIEAKDMNNKTEALLTFTNQRIICESVTKSRERQLLLERPIGSVSTIAKGKLGLFAGEGLLVEFKQPSDHKLKFGTKGEDADLSVQYFNMIASGQIDDEIESGISVTVSERFKELASASTKAEELTVKEVPIEVPIEVPKVEVHEDINIGKCPKCGTEVSSPKKKWKMAGRLEMLEIGLFDCPKCHKPFRVILSKEKI